MIRLILTSTRTFCMSLAVVLALAAPASLAQETAPAAPAAAAAPAVAPASEDEQLQELEEVMVRGSRLLDIIADKEDVFYDVFNKLNKDENYDTSCVYLNLDPQSLTASIKSRVCLPGFVADAMADFQIWKMRCEPPTEGFDEFDCLDRNKDSRISWQEATARQEIDDEFTTLDEDLDGKLTRDEFNLRSFGASVVHQPPPPQLVLMEGTKKWYDHMMKVIRENPELQDMAGELDDLYRELAQVQTRYAELDPNLKADKGSSTRRTSGPREP